MQNNDDKPTGVFVRLPLSDAQLGKLLAPIGPLNERLLAIGTPVTGGELEVVGYAPGEDLPLYGDEGIDDTCFTEISLHRQADNDVPLVRQSDALAKLAEKDAEIAKKDTELERLRSALEDIEMGIDALPDDNEDYSKITAQEMQRQALFIVRSEVKALKGPGS